MSKKKWFASELVDLANIKEKGMVAKKDFAIHHNDFHLEIKKGDDLSKVPPIYWDNLKTEQVI